MIISHYNSKVYRQYYIKNKQYFNSSNTECKNDNKHNGKPTANRS